MRFLNVGITIIPTLLEDTERHPNNNEVWNSIECPVGEVIWETIREHLNDSL
jgi:hypothetical protein